MMRTFSRILGPLVVLLCASTGAECLADVVDVPASQVGGFYAGGAAPDNSVAFQNYFVGYGTSPGGGRTPERRAFFIFPLAGVPGPVTSAKLTLHLVAPGGLIFGKGDGTPPMPVPSDPTETFQLTTTPFSSLDITSATAGASASFIFDSLDDAPGAPPLTFGTGFPPPMPPAEGVPAVIEISLSAAGIAAINGALSAGEIVLGGWMSSWSEDLREFPPMSGSFVEGSELMFGFSDVHSTFPSPVLSLTAVPEVSAAWFGGAAAMLSGGYAYAVRRSMPWAALRRNLGRWRRT